MNTETQIRSTSALATHCYAMLMTAMPAVTELARVHGVLLTEDALNFIEDTAATCLIQSAVTIARARGYEDHGIDFATVNAVEAGKVFVELSQCPEFRERMAVLRAGPAGEDEKRDETIGPSGNETMSDGESAAPADDLPVSLFDSLFPHEPGGETDEDDEAGDAGEEGEDEGGDAP